MYSMIFIEVNLLVVSSCRGWEEPTSETTGTDLVPGEGLGADEGEVDVRRPLHDEPGERDGVGDGGEA